MVHRRIVRRPRPARNDLTTPRPSRASENSQSTPLRGWERTSQFANPSEHSTHASASARANPAIAASSLRNPRRKRSDISICTLASPNAVPCCDSVHIPSGRLPVNTGSSFTTNVSSPPPSPPTLSPSSRVHASRNARRRRPIAARSRRPSAGSAASNAAAPMSQSPGPISVALVDGSRRP